VSDAPASNAPASIRWWRVACAAALALLTVSAFRSEYGRIPLLGDVNLAIHEFGHMLFQPFGVSFAGDTMVILGGSLVQVMFPFIFVAYFLRRREGSPRDLFAVAIFTWWIALNVLDVSVYVGDSRAGELMMLSGETAADGAPHDWRELLSRWGVLHRDTLYASKLRGGAGLLAFGSLVIGALWEVFFPVSAAAAELEPSEAPG
jgi:hypothetical protein